MIDYYDLIMGAASKCFIPTFNELWKNEIKSHKLPYGNALQIETGNRLRPLLMAWGYYANCRMDNNGFIADYAISIELIHKASILLDDLLDNDIARHEKATFHIQYSEADALLYAIYLLNRSITRIHHRDIDNHFIHTPVLLKIIDNMTRGGIKEMCSPESIFDIKEVKEIIDLETVSLIENSFVLGYQLSSQPSTNVPEDIVNIGRLCGYCFQILNDIEPFSAPEINQKYKGNMNYDFSKHRKNIVIAFLYGICSQKERKKMREKSSSFTYICTLVEKYDVLSTLLNEVEIEITNILQCITRLNDTNVSFYNDFKKFIFNMFKICYHKCNLTFNYELLNY